MAARARRVEIQPARRQGKAASPFVSSQTLKNAFLEMDPETGDAAINGGPGFRLFCDTGEEAPIRGARKFGDLLIVVAGPTIYTVDRNGQATAYGTVMGVEPVIMSDNGTQAVIVADANSYILGYLFGVLIFGEITDPDFPTATSVDFFDQYMMFTKTNTGEFFISALSDASQFDALDIASAESNPDNLVRVFVDNREALLFGSNSVEGWYDAGDADFPFVRDNTYLEVGALSKYAIAAIDNSVAFLASDKTVRIIRSGSPRIISDVFASAEIERWSDASATKCFSYTLRGHQFLVLRNPDGCLLWDASLPPQVAWSSRQSHNSDTWRIWCAESVWEKIIVGDAETGKLYVLDPDAFDEAGEPMIGELVSRTMGVNGNPFTVDTIEAQFEPGVSLVTGQGSDATVWLEASRDGGYSFGARMERSLGAVGVRPQRIVWRGLAQFPPHGGVLKFGWSDPVRIVLTKAHAEISEDAA